MQENKYSEKLMKPVEYYNNHLKEKFHKNTEEHLDKLVKLSQLNIEKNRSDVKKYNEIIEKKNNVDGENKKYKFIRFLFYLLIAASIFFLYFKVIGPLINYDYLSVGEIILYSSMSIGGVVLSWRYISKKLNIIIEKNQKNLDEYELLAKEQINICYSETRKIFPYIDEMITIQLIRQTLPFIEIDDYVRPERFDQLKRQCDFQENLADMSQSTVEVLSGTILGNPYVILQNLRRDIVEETYRGSKTIFWTERYYDGEKWVTVNKSQTLTASVRAPKAVYSKEVQLVYGNDAAPDLVFSRNPGYIHTKHETSIDRKVKRDLKKLNRKARKAVTGPGDFVRMDNSEFEILFNALDRNHEQQFRLLFTPLAQQNMVNVLKNSRYGDDFYFTKYKRSNIIKPEHGLEWNMNTSPEKYYSHSYDVLREKFLMENSNYFSHFYHIFLPLLAIPLYQQHKSENYIYERDYSYNYHGYSTEVLANELDVKDFSHSNTGTPVILKTRHKTSLGATDIVEVEAHSYQLVDRTEYVSVYGGDGRWHRVAVPWIEYIPLKKNSNIEVRNLNLSDREFEKLKSQDDFQRTMSNLSGSYVYKNRLMAKVINKIDKSNDDIIDRLIKSVKE